MDGRGQKRGESVRRPNLQGKQRKTKQQNRERKNAQRWNAESVTVSRRNYPC